MPNDKKELEGRNPLVEDFCPKEKQYYVISFKHSSGGYLTLWAPNDAGYTTNVDKAGKYTESDIKDHMGYYHNGDNIAMEINEFEKRYNLKRIAEPNYMVHSDLKKRVKNQTLI